MTKVLALLALACGGCLTLSDFQFGRKVPEQELAGSAVRAPLESAFPLGLDLDVSEYLDKGGPQAEVRLAGLTLTITPTDEPPGDADDFAFLTELHVFVSSASLPRVEIASARLPGAARTIELATDPALDLAPCVREGCTVDATGAGDLPADDVTFDGLAEIAVHPD